MSIAVIKQKRTTIEMENVLNITGVHFNSFEEALDSTLKSVKDELMKEYNSNKELCDEYCKDVVTELSAKAKQSEDS